MGGRILSAALLAFGVFAAGCFGPSLGDQPYVCGTTEPLCPPGYGCVGQICTRDGVTTADSGPPDARPVDARLAPDGFTCPAAGTFLTCKDSDTAFVCDGSLTAVERECPSGCDAAGKLCKQCVPSTTSCKEDQVVTCTAAGEIGTSRSCPVGCNASGTTPACYTLVPSNVPDGCDGDNTLQSLTVTADMRIETGGQSCSEVLSQGATAPELCVLRYRDVSVAAGATLTFRGARGVVLIALGTMSIDGKIDAAGRGPIPGPGARPAQLLGRGQSAAMGSSIGGGGGGYGGVGGSGGATVDVDTRLPGGSSYGMAANVPLLSGASGGTGGYDCLPSPCTTARDSGGAGGGALQLVACTELDVAGTAVIDCGGGGGSGGNGGVADPIVITPGGGDGGGSGGSILIEAPQVTLPRDAALVANGGAGGGGGTTGGFDNRGKPGDDGRASEDPAAGGEGADSEAGDGGDGATGSRTADPGDIGSPTGGGGGGAPGRVRVNSRMDKPPVLPGNAVLSPTPSTGSITRK